MTVTITAYRRPNLLRQCLESIANADLSPVTEVILSLDFYDGPTICAMVDAFREFLREMPLIECRWFQRFGRYGVANNTRAAYQEAVKYNAEVICALEEDTTVAPDAFLYADWALRDMAGKVYQQYAFVNLCSHQDPLGTDPTKVHEDNQLRGGYGWAFTRQFWEYLEPRWNGKNRAPYGWDWNVTHLCYREQWTVLTPEVSRVRHIGREDGTYMTPAIFDATPQRLCEVTPERYKIVRHELDWRQPTWISDELKP